MLTFCCNKSKTHLLVDWATKRPFLKFSDNNLLCTGLLRLQYFRCFALTRVHLFRVNFLLYHLRATCYERWPQLSIPSLGSCLFTTRRGVSEKSFFANNFIGVIFEEGNETREKLWSDFGAKQKWRVERKESGFLFISLFSREQEIEVWKIFLWASEIFLFTCDF